MFTITKEFHFSAGHVLNGLPDGHPCGRRHGHNYIIRMELGSTTLDETGFVQDYGELQPVKDWINDVVDHYWLNDKIPGQPSAENIAKHVYHLFKSQFPLLISVSVSETPKTWAKYIP